jgi:hypothetical protein
MLTSLIIHAIRARGHLAWRNAQLRRGRKYGGLGEGSTDVIACIRGRFVGLEVKLPKGRVPVSEEQVRWIERLNRHGGFGLVVRSLAEAMAVVNEVGGSVSSNMREGEPAQ